MISWSRTLSVYKDFWYTYYKSIGHRQMFLLPADSADVVYTETRSHVRKRSVENTQRRTTAPFCVAVVSSVVVHWLIVVIYCPPRASDSVWSTG